MSDTPTSSPFVIDVTTESFQQDVIDRSKSALVLIDFWAAWCQPCRMLSPVLEKIANEYNGKILLAKVDTDAQSELALQFGVRSIPVVFAVRGGNAVDAFTGVQPESAIRAWIDRLLPTAGETLAAEALGLEQSNPEAAVEKYKAALEIEPGLIVAQTGLARIALDQGRLDDARVQILEMERRGFLEPDAEKIKAELMLRLQAGGVGGVQAARDALAANPQDSQLKFQLAEALAAAGQYADALALCLELVEHDRKGIGEKARKTMVAIFQLLPPESPEVAEYQRQLSFVLMD